MTGNDHFAPGTSSTSQIRFGSSSRASFAPGVPLEGNHPLPLRMQMAVSADRSVLDLLLYSLLVKVSSSVFYSYINPCLSQILHLGTAGIGSTMLGRSGSQRLVLSNAGTPDGGML
ncbi:hypothetical protein ACLBWT_20525 [Paenibacillus sp. D51F]